MAKNSNKKKKRNRGKIKAAKVRSDFEKTERRDMYDEAIRKDNIAHANYYKQIQAACKNPKQYANAYLTIHSPASYFARQIKDRNLGPQEQGQLSKLVDVCRRTKLLNKNSSVHYSQGLVNLSKWQWCWVNDPDLWKPKSHNTDKQFESLAEFLLCKYKIPPFMNAAWFEDGAIGEKHQEWYVNLGSGENIRKQKGLPLELTKRMAHEFSQAPTSFKINEAVQWSRLVAMGADRKTAMAIMETPLRENFSNVEFWNSVIRVYIENPMLDTYQYGPLYDYIYDQKFRDRGAVYVDGEIVNEGPPQPNLSLRGRDVNNLIRQMEIWHRDMRRQRQTLGVKTFNSSWNSCGIPSYRKKGKESITEITEILTSADLYTEGEKMKHCVGTYARSCSTGICAIYSLRITDDNGMRREATISVKPSTKTISEARKSCNRGLTKSDWSSVMEWAKQANLSVSSWLSR